MEGGTGLIRVDSRKVQAGDIFVAICGGNFDGHDFALDAERRGAIKVYCEREIEGLKIPQEIVESSRYKAGELASEFFGHPSERFKLVGVTGTNGKTTVTYMVKAILEASGAKVGLIGTNQNMIGSEVLETVHTTPESVDLQELFFQMAEAGCEYVVMEVSSHGLALDRVVGSKFLVGGFTNLSQDHLDFHGTMEEYFKAKAKLFEMAEHSVVNTDGSWGERLAGMVGEGCMRVSAKDIDFELPPTIVGDFNVQNIAVARGMCKALGLSDEQIMQGIMGFNGVSGRMEVVPVKGRDFTVIIDYAHTPDGLESVLKTVQGFAKGRVVVLFGCGGDRDNIKRPIMGEIAGKYADFCIVTSDNPRTEEPEKIIEQILAGMDSGAEKVVIPSRAEAIKWAMQNARTDDVVVLAGKGHENYQILGTEKIHFDEREHIAEALKGVDNSGKT